MGTTVLAETQFQTWISITFDYLCKNISKLFKYLWKNTFQILLFQNFILSSFFKVNFQLFFTNTEKNLVRLIQEAEFLCFQFIKIEPKMKCSM